MVVRGRIHNGVVVLDGGLALPEGTEVTVSFSIASEKAAPDSRRRLRLPLVPSARPGSRLLTAERVAEILEEDDVSAGRQSVAGPGL